MSSKSHLSVAIVISTMNRPDFVIRQLEYYARVKNPHPIYIGDAGDKENTDKLKRAVEQFGKDLKIKYYIQPERCSTTESRQDLYAKVQEKYCAFSGDDDYQVPDSLTKCAEFLENNPDYSSASGRSVSFRLKENGVYGELRRLDEYPMHQIESGTAGQRLSDLMSDFYITEFTVQKTEIMKSFWKPSPMKDPAFSVDIMSSVVSLLAGKSKVLDCLGIIRQLDNMKAPALNTFDWIKGKDWASSCQIFCEILAKKISDIDGISEKEAFEIARKSVWTYLNMWLPYEYKKIYGDNVRQRNSSRNILRKFKFKLGQKLPWLKNIYTKASYSLPNNRQEIFYEVTKPSSPYYLDFQMVLDSFTGKYR